MIGHTIVIVAGLTWVGSACVLAEVGRLLGPSFVTSRTVHPVWRVAAWLGSLVFLLRGLTLLYPGQLIEVSRVSIMAPAGAVVVLGVTLALLHWIQSERSPPPWSEQVLRVVALLGRDGPVKVAAMTLPPAAIGDLPPVDEPIETRWGRLSVLICVGAVLVAVAAFLAGNSPGL